MLEALNAMGAQLAIDDCGTVCSSRSYLKHFPIGALNIDSQRPSWHTFTAGTRYVRHRTDRTGLCDYATFKVSTRRADQAR